MPWRSRSRIGAVPLREGLIRLMPRATGDGQYRRLVEPGLALERAYAA